MTKTQAKQLVVCVENDGYAVSLEKRKIYVALRDAAAEKQNFPSTMPVIRKTPKSSGEFCANGEPSTPSVFVETSDNTQTAIGIAIR